VSLSRALLRRIADLIFVMWFMATIVFFLLRVLPGDPVQLLVGMDVVNEDAVAKLRTQFGLDRPLLTQYVLWLGNLIQGNFGESLRSGTSVISLILAAVPVTFELAVIAFAIALALSIPLGMTAGRYRGRILDVFSSTAALIGISTPSFVLALGGIYIFAVGLHVLPVTGFVPLLVRPLDNLRHMILPGISLGLISAGILMRLMRRSVIDESDQDYVRTARAKGAGEGRVFYGHVMRNAIIPYLTVAGLEAGFLLSGAVITETIFALPGLGRLMVDNIMQRDYAVVEGAVCVVTAIYVLINFGVDVLYTLLDPRVKLG
jgi:peptide/nickel transport system permease protein